MGGKRRNKNKADRDEMAMAPSSSTSRKSATAAAAAANAGDSGRTDEDDSDLESVGTHLSLDDDLQSVLDDNELDEDMESDGAISLSSKLSEFLDNATHKNISIRLAAMDNIHMLLIKRYMADDVENWTVTLVDLIEKSLKKTDEEAFRAALLAALISIQLGNSLSDKLDSICLILCEISSDASRTARLRVQCAYSLSICSFICIEQPQLLAKATNTLRAIWSATKTNAPASALFSAAITGWSLLIHQAGRRTLEAAILDEPKVCTYIDGAQVDMRISAGEALTVLYEAAVDTMGEGYHFPNHQYLIEMLASLSNDSFKFHAKKDRRVQRYSFRQIYNAIKDQQAPQIRIKFGVETLELDSCANKLLYDLLCGLLRGGMNAHLKLNPILREIFDLGPVQNYLPTKINKLQRMAIQNAVSKSRDLQRAKQRDKRSC